MSKKYTKRWFKATVIRMYNIFAQCLGAYVHNKYIF